MRHLLHHRLEFGLVTQAKDSPAQIFIGEAIKEMQQRRLSVKYSLEKHNELLVLFAAMKHSYKGKDHLFCDSSTVSK